MRREHLKPDAMLPPSWAHRSPGEKLHVRGVRKQAGMPDNESTPKPNANPTTVREPSNTRPPDKPTPDKPPQEQSEKMGEDEGKDDIDVQGK